MIRTLLLSVALAVVCVLPPAGVVTMAGCGTQPVVPSSAIAAAQDVAATATTVVADAVDVWPAIYAALPPAQQAQAQPVFNQAVFAANHAILALDDAIQAAIAIDGGDAGDAGAPNLTAAIGDVAAAVAQVVAIVAGFTALTPADSGAAALGPFGDAGASAAADMRRAATRLLALTGH